MRGCDDRQVGGHMYSLSLLVMIQRQWSKRRRVPASTLYTFKPVTRQSRCSDGLDRRSRSSFRADCAPSGLGSRPSQASTVGVVSLQESLTSLQRVKVLCLSLPHCNAQGLKGLQYGTLWRTGGDYQHVHVSWSVRIENEDERQ